MKYILMITLMIFSGQVLAADYSGDINCKSAHLWAAGYNDTQAPNRNECSMSIQLLRTHGDDQRSFGRLYIRIDEYNSLVEGQYYVREFYGTYMRQSNRQGISLDLVTRPGVLSRQGQLIVERDENKMRIVIQYKDTAGVSRQLTLSKLVPE